MTLMREGPERGLQSPVHGFDSRLRLIVFAGRAILPNRKPLPAPKLFCDSAVQQSHRLSLVFKIPFVHLRIANGALLVRPFAKARSAVGDAVA